MLTLQVVPFESIQQWFVDFQKKSHCYEMPEDTTTNIGVFLETTLIGYFILQDYEDGTLEIQQGYLKPIARHKQLSYDSMKLLQQKAKERGYKRIILKASRTLKAYTKFMGNLGFRPQTIIFSKDI